MKEKSISTIILVLVGFAISYFAFRNYWWIFLLTGGLLTALSFFIPESTPVIQGAVVSNKESKSMPEGQFLIPKNWDPDEIGVQIRKLRHNRSVLTAFVDSVITRFVTGQDQLVSKTRIEFLRTKLEELQLSKELQASLDELEFRETNLSIKRLELEVQKEGLEAQKAKQTEITDLERERDALKIKVEMAHLNKQIRDLQEPQHEPQQRSSEEIKRENRSRVEKEIENWNAEEEKLKADTKLREDDKRRRLNMISKKKDELYQQLEKYM